MRTAFFFILSLRTVYKGLFWICLLRTVSPKNDNMSKKRERANNVELFDVICRDYRVS